MFYIFILLFVLSGCSAGNNTENKPEDKTEKKEETAQTEQTEQIAKPDQKKDVYVPNPQVTDDLNLVKVGETLSDARGELTLKA